MYFDVPKIKHGENGSKATKIRISFPLHLVRFDRLTKSHRLLAACERWKWSARAFSVRVLDKAIHSRSVFIDHITRVIFLAMMLAPAFKRARGAAGKPC